MAVRTPRRLPGFRFEVQPPPLTEVLPRMDVAVFVGFAASGPLHTPVLVEEAARFTAVFGADAPLAWDDQRGEMVCAYLAPAVRAFFRNGGQRCWIVRVAGPDAIVNHFHLADLMRIDGGVRTPTFIEARSAGSWSDTLEVATTLESEVLATGNWNRYPPTTLDLALATPVPIALGDLLRLTFADGFVLMCALTSAGNTLTPTWPAPPPQRLVGVERLTFTLHARQGEQAAWRLGGLGFAPGHPRYWGDLPSDADLYRQPDRPASELWSASASPRFPLAAANPTAAVCFPIDMPIAPTAWTRMQPHTASPLERDGLAHFDASLFFDTRDSRSLRSLLEAGAGNLLAEADYLRYQGSAPDSLGGLYAALDIEEATLVAVPDAVHRGWSLAADSPTPPAPVAPPRCCQSTIVPPPVAPSPPEPSFLACHGRVLPAPHLTMTQSGDTFTLSWTTAPDADYVLEEEADVVYRGDANLFEVTRRPPGDYHYRVRAIVAGVMSDYSNTVAVHVAANSRWRVTPVDDYEDHALVAVQRALLRLCAARADLFALLALPEHYRESKAIAHVAQLTSPNALAREVRFADRATVRPLSQGESSALSYGALYHPWLVGREENTPAELRRTPPDGACCGILARRALARGAWIAPANEPVRGVVALTPAIDPAAQLDLQETQINLLRQEPHGFVALNADTLSPDDDLRPINVRRLLILLRRLALRLGAGYVFEPNDDSLRRAVQRGFEAQLEYLFVRGAFAGRSPDTSFQVVTDSSLNTPRSIEQGRFIVELRVAPSVPLTFLTLRLVQTGDRGLVAEVR